MKNSFFSIRLLTGILILAFLSNRGFGQSEIFEKEKKAIFKNNLEVVRIYSPQPNDCYKIVPEGPFSLEMKIRNNGKTTSHRTRVAIQYAPFDSNHFKTMRSIEVPPLESGKSIVLREDNLTYRMMKGEKYKIKAILQYSDDDRSDNIGKIIVEVVGRQIYNSTNCN